MKRTVPNVPLTLFALMASLVLVSSPNPKHCSSYQQILTVHLDCGPGAVLGAGHVAVNKTRPNGRGGSKGRQTIRQYLVNKYTNK